MTGPFFHSANNNNKGRVWIVRKILFAEGLSQDNDSLEVDTERKKDRNRRAVVVAHFVERSLPTPEIRGSNPVVGEISY